MVLPRVLTAVLAAPLFLWVLWLGGPAFFLFLSMMVLLASWEFHSMAEEGGHATQGLWGVALGLVLAGGFFLSGLRPELPFARQAPALALTLATLLSVGREMARRDKGLSVLRLAMTAASLLLVAWPLGYLGLLRELRGEGELYQAGRQAILFLTAIIWTQDTAAWAVGKAVGRHKMARVISPGKSWEGAAAGLAAAVLAGLALRESFFPGLLGRGESALVTVFLGALAQASDLAESLLKRCFGVKDSSRLLPGHGGVLDRFDSFLLTAPLFYFYLSAAGR